MHTVGVFCVRDCCFSQMSYSLDRRRCASVVLAYAQSAVTMQQACDKNANPLMPPLASFALAIAVSGGRPFLWIIFDISL